MTKPFWKGLHMIDFIVLLILFAGLSTLIACRYNRFKCRALESEAKFFLQEFFAAEKAFFKLNGKYATIDKLYSEGRIVNTAKYFTFIDLIPPSEEEFAIAALGINSIIKGEKLSINHLNEITSITAICP